jgi:glycosyltransferase involved in cell wall biosynthesis
LVIRALAGRGGGAERIYCELANMLAEDGFDVTCLHFDEVDGESFYPLRTDVERINLAPVHRVGPSVRNVTRLKRAIFTRITGSPLGILLNSVLWRVLNRRFVAQLNSFYVSRRPDAVISFLPPANTPALAAARGTATRVIVTNHNVPELDYTSPRRWDPNPHDQKLRLSLLDGAAAIHVLSSRFASWFPQHLQSRIVVVPNYVSADILESRPARQRAKMILGVGRLAEAKNYAVLLEAWALLHAKYPEWQVVIHGEGPQRKILQEAVECAGVGGSFLIAGQRPDVASEYGRAAIFCHPALYEGFGLVAAEALALETPVVAFADCAGLDEFVVHEQNGLLVDRAGGAEALAAGLSKLIEDEELRQRLGANGPSSIAPYSQDRYRQRWRELLARVMS